MRCFKCLIGILSIFRCRDCLLRKFAFRPPKPAHYHVVDGALSLMTSKGPVPIFSFPWLELRLVFLETNLKSKIPAIHLIHEEADFTIIYSHGNSSDIGNLYNYVLDMATHLKVSILLYEYSGYGITSGRASETSLRQDIKAAYTYLLQETACNNIILLGNSIGSYPSCSLASKLPVGGVILQSPLASALSLAYNSFGGDYKRDMFNCINLVSQIASPVLVVHGAEDASIPITHAEELVKLLKNPSKPLWINEGTHNNIETTHRTELYARLLEFLNEISRKRGLEAGGKPAIHSRMSSGVSSKNTTHHALDQTFIDKKKKKK